jgi:N-acetylglucosamine malate deacetylase 1
MLFVPFVGDIHVDHQQTFASALVASRPDGTHTPESIYAYETLSETNWNAPYLTPQFSPNVFMDMTPFLEKKIDAIKCFASQLKPFPHERSEKAIRALALLRGSYAGVAAAEAFVLIRKIVRS